MDLADQKCVPCRGGVPAMDRARANELLRELGAGWRLNDEGHLEREYRVRNFREAMDLANKVADVGLFIGAIILSLSVGSFRFTDILHGVEDGAPTPALLTSKWQAPKRW